MTMKIFFLINISFCVINAYDLGSISPCQSSNKQQSPISIISEKSKYREERNFRIISSNYSSFNTTWVDFNEEKTIGFQGKNLGYILFLKNWSIYKFNLEKIYFRYGSSHIIDEMSYDVEMELVHSLDETYRTPGRYIHPTAQYLIISTFFVVKKGISSDPASLFFETINLATYANNFQKTDIYFKAPLNLNQVVQNMPGYFYEGTITNGYCDNAWRLILPKYQLMKQDEFDQLKALLLAKNFINAGDPNSHNYRSPQPINSSTEVYVNDMDSTRLLITANTNQYASAFLNIFNLKVLLLMIAIFFFN